MKNWILSRLKEKTTWIGITTIVSAAGITLNPEQIQLIATIGSTIIGLILTFTKEVKQGITMQEVKDERMDTARAEGTDQIGADVGP